MPASSRRGKPSKARFGGACTATSSGSRRRAAAIVQRWSSSSGSGWPAMRVPGFARKFWTITSCRWPCCACSSASAASASSRSSRVSPMPIRIPLVNGIRSSPASAIVSSRRAGTLSGEAQCGPPFAPSRSAVVSSMIPIDAGDRTELRELLARHHARVQVRQQARLLEHEPGDAGEVLERRLAAESAQLLSRDLVAELRLVAEREQRLGAPGRGAGARDPEHLLLGQVRALAAARRPRERAVAADVAAERRQRDEDLRRVRDEAVAAAARARGRQQVLERCGEEVRAVHPRSLRRPRRRGASSRSA